MKVYIEHDHITDGVKVWIYNNEPNGTVYMWPTHRSELGDMIWQQEIVAEHALRPEHIRPALEMSGWMWKPFIEAIRAEDHDQPAGALLFKTLEREQARVDVLVHALIAMTRPQMYITSEKGEL